MSTISIERRNIQSTTDWALYRAHREHLADLHASIAHSGQAKRPLALSTKADLLGAETGLSAADIKHFLRAYTFGPKYLRTLKVGAPRYDLDGLVDGEVTAEEAEYAALCLRAHYSMRRAGRLGMRAVAGAVATPVEPTYVEPTYAYRFAREAA